jgi:tetratricopeptide (TPR) repeat protein
MRGIKFFLTICCCLILTSCTVYQQVVTVVTEPVKDEPEVDLSCSYFYFLWGSHAEFTERYAEALEAYEKAVICDPKAEYLREKIPVLLLKMGDVEKAAEWLGHALIEYPDENSSRLLLASLYIQQDKIPEAITLYDEVLRRDPDNEGVHLRLGLLYGHQEEFDKAEKIFRQLLDRNGNSYFARLSLARLLRQTDKNEEAGQEYEKALALNWSKELAYEIGIFYASRKKHGEALRLYTAIAESDPFDERAGLSRVQAFLDMEKYDEALEELKNIITFSKNPANIELIVSKVLLRQNEVSKAKEILEKLTNKIGNSEARYMLALLAYRDEDFKTALDHLGKIMPGNTDFEEAVYLQTRIFKESGESNEAMAMLKKHIAKESSRSPLFYALLSSLYQEKKDNISAMSVMAAAVSIYPDNPQLLFEYGLLLDRNGMGDQAIVKMEKVLELRPDHADALNFIGYTWAEKNVRLREALAYIQKAVALKPDNGYIIDSLGWVYYRLGDYARAVEELERALGLEPEDPHIYDHLGDAYRGLNNIARALDRYKKAFEMFEDEKKKSAVKQKIDALESRE